MIGADPTATIEELARKKEVPIFSVSMGEGQEPHAKKCITDGVAQGPFARCHGLFFQIESVTKRGATELAHVGIHLRLFHRRGFSHGFI